MEYDLTSFSRGLEGLWDQMQRHYFTDDLNLAERLLLQVDDYLKVLRAIYGRVMEFTAQLPSADRESIVNDVGVVYTELCKYSNYYQDRIEEETRKSPVHSNQWQCPVESTGHPGRPPFLVPMEHIEAFIEFGFTYEQMSAVLGISSRTLRRRRLGHGLPVGRNYTEIPDTELDQEINSILMVTADSGLSMMRGALQARGIMVQRQRVYDSMRRVDPVSQSLRRTARIYRRQYSVPGPNALWHLDGNHKLIRWKFVIHGGIDGFSRLIVYLRCSNNNRAQTVLQYFEQAVTMLELPSRVRCDYGVENVDVGMYMLRNRGTGRGSVITGSSVHNQRVERMWRDVRRIVIRNYQNLFHYMEDAHLLDSLNEIHLVALHHVFTPRINRALDEFMAQHNHHPLRTEQNHTPRQLFYFPELCGYDVPFRDSSGINVATYGIDEEAPVPSNVEDGMIVVPPFRVHLSNYQLSMLNLTIPPLQEDDNFGIHLYMQAVDFLNQC